MRVCPLGRRYDENGNVRQWWSKETLRHYHEKVECMIRQYSNYHLPELGDNFTVSNSIFLTDKPKLCQGSSLNLTQTLSIILRKISQNVRCCLGEWHKYTGGEYSWQRWSTRSLQSVPKIQSEKHWSTSFTRPPGLYRRTIVFHRFRTSKWPSHRIQIFFSSSLSLIPHFLVVY